MRTRSPRTRQSASIAALLALCVSAHASGRIELNQAQISAAGGFPYTITAPGSYVLTGSLVVPASTDGLVLAASDVTLDLNGFSISGSHTCTAGGCPLGSSKAIRPSNVASHANRTTVRNGIVSGFGDNCVQLGDHARVDDLVVIACGRHGIAVSSGSVVTHCRVDSTGGNGLTLSSTSEPPAYAHNTVNDSGLGVGGVAVSGGRATSGNVCDDGTCTADGRRFFYVTTGVFDGAAADSACAPGFHMASLFELHDPSSLAYDATRGRTTADAGAGPPVAPAGWIRTGSGAGIVAWPGLGNCNAWTSSFALDYGTAMTLSSDWNEAADTDDPWSSGFGQCDVPRPVWCIQN